MRLIAKIVLWLLGGLAAIVAAGVVFLLFFDWNQLRGTLNERASAASGREVEVRGDLRVDLWSRTPQLVAQDVVVGNPSWAAEPQMLHVAEVYLKVRLLPIFAGRLEVERLRMVEPQLALERRDGKANWNLGDAGPGGAAAEAAAPKERQDFPVLKHLEVERGDLSFHDPDLQEPIEVTLESLTVEAGGFDDPVRLTAEGSYLEKSFSLEGSGESFEKFRSTEEPYDLTLDARIGNTQLAVEGSLQAPLQLSGIDAALDLKGDNLQELHTLFALPLPDSPPYALTGRLTRQGDRWALNGFDGRLGDSDLGGDLEVATGGERPRLVADVRSDSFRIEDIEVFWGGDSEEEETPADREHVLPDEPLALPKLRRMDAEVRFSGNSVTSGELQLQNLSTELRLEDGLLRLQPLELGLADGRIAATLRLDGRGDVPEMGGEVRVEGLQIDALLALLGQKDAGGGLLRGRVELAMRGRSWRELGASANGEGALVMSDGRLENILLELIALDLQEAAGQWLTAEEEQVEVLCLAMPTQIESGRFEAQPWILDTTDAIVTITGYVDLGSEQVDITLEPHPKDFSLFNYLTSIQITGDLSERTVNTDPLEAAAKVVLKAAAAPIMPLLSEDIQESAEAQSVPCPALRQRLESAMAEGEVGVEELPDQGNQAGQGNQGNQGEPPNRAAEVEAGATPDVETISRVQAALNDAGFDLAVDGVLGPNTRAALREFQQRRNMPQSGRPDAETLRRLGLAPAAPE